MDLSRTSSTAWISTTATLLGRRRSLRRVLLLFALISIAFFFADGLRDLFEDATGIHSHIHANSPNPITTPSGPPTRTRVVRLTKTVTETATPEAVLRHPEVFHDPLLVWKEKHVYRDDGLLQVNSEGAHPIFELIRNAEKTWKEKNDRQSKTLREAVQEYRKRHGRNPPKGFDHWWNYVKKHNVPLPDEYGRIYEDLEPFWGINPVDLNKVIDEWQEMTDTWTFGKVLQSDPIGVLRHAVREEVIQELFHGAVEQIDVILDVEDFIPPFRAVFWPHDNPYLLTDWEMRRMALDAAKEGKYIDLSASPTSEKLNGWISGCAPFTAAWKEPIDFLSETAPVSHLHVHMPTVNKTFIHDHHKAMDPCHHPDIFRSHGQFLAHNNPGPLPHRKLIPLFTWSPSMVHSDIRPVVTMNWVEDVLTQNIDWDKKLDERLYWRGAPTGILNDDTLDLGEGRIVRMRWRQAQRSRVVRLTSPIDPLVLDYNGKEEYLRNLPTPPDGATFDIDKFYVLPSPEWDHQPVGKPKEFLRANLAPALMDVNFAGKPAACTPDTCDRMATIFDFSRSHHSAETGRYKYVFDIDGNGWSSRFKRLITGNVVIFKTTIYPEWFIDRIQPWYHYVPIQNDLSDLYDALMFFRGDEARHGRHDDLAKQIAMQARQWSKTHWRKEDMTAYMFRLFLEYARVTSPDRDSGALDFVLEEERAMHEK